jgi:hypothetical protein
MFRVERIDEDQAQRIAHIMGSDSAHAKALAEVRRRRESGESVSMVKAGDHTVLVVRDEDLMPSNMVDVTTPWTEHVD